MVACGESSPCQQAGSEYRQKQKRGGLRDHELEVDDVFGGLVAKVVEKGGVKIVRRMPDRKFTVVGSWRRVDLGQRGVEKLVGLEPQCLDVGIIQRQGLAYETL